MSIGTFFVTLAVVEKASADEFLEELKEKSWRLYLAEWVVWPPAQMINFFFLPLKYRVLYDNTISLGYDVYTSYVKNEIPTKRTPPDLPSSIAVRSTSLIASDIADERNERQSFPVAQEDSIKLNSEDAAVL